MVSARNYLQVFVTLLPRKVKATSAALKKKKPFASIIRRKGILDEKQTEAFCELIGRDILFNPAKKRHQQNLRHVAFKARRGLVDFIDKGGRPPRVLQSSRDENSDDRNVRALQSFLMS